MNKEDAPASLPSNEPRFMEQFEESIKSYADAVQAGDDNAAAQAAMAALALAGMEAMTSPTPDILLLERAAECEARQDWAGAEAAYREVLALKAVAENPRYLVKPHLNLSKLFRLVGRKDEAWAEACTATGLARGADMFTLLTMALDNEASCALDRADLDGAMAAAVEALEIIEPGKIFDTMRARSLTRRAECLLARNEPDPAEQDLKRSWELLHSRAPLGIGSIVVLAHWWEVQGQLHLCRRAIAEARTALTEAAQYRRQVLESGESPNPYAAASLLRVQDKLAALPS